MAGERDPDAFLKSRGVKLPEPEPRTIAPKAEPKVTASPTTAAAPTAPAAPSTTAAAPRFDKAEYRKQLYDNDWSIRATVGASKALAGIPIGLSRLAAHISPRLGELAKTTRQNYPEMDRAITALEQHADAPSRSRTESLGYGAGLLGSAVLTPGIGGARVGARIFPPLFTRRGFVQPFPRAATTARRVGETADVAAKGAIGGAIGNPDDPGTAALGGAVLGPAAKGLGAAMRTAGAQRIGAHVLPHAALAWPAYSMLTSMGVPSHLAWGVFPALSWYHMPSAAPFRRVGANIIDATGKVIASIPPAMLGYFGGQPTGVAAKAGAEAGSEVVKDVAAEASKDW